MPISTAPGCNGSCDAAKKVMPRDLVRRRGPNGQVPGPGPEPCADGTCRGTKSRDTARGATPLITSAHNPKLRLIHRLLESRRQREKEGLFVVEGEDLVQAADDAGVEPVEVLRAGEDVEPELLAKVSTMGHPPRVMGLFRHESLPRGVDPLSLSLWRVVDPGNLGTILRAADAFGASVALSRGCADPTGPKALRASAGAIFRVPLAGFDEPSGKRVALVSYGGRPLARLDPGVPVTYVLGAEREGLPADIISACDETATIPLAEGSESLNVAVAGAIALYEHRRGR
jgi:RNA methyltransferase, TrmH family